MQLTAATTTETGLRVRCENVGILYPRGVKVTEQEMQAINIARDGFPARGRDAVATATPDARRQ